MTDFPPAGCLRLESLPAAQQYALASFGRAADEVFRFWVPHRDHKFSVTMFRASAPDAAELIPETPFRSLALAVRLVYLPSEKGAFGNVVKILRSEAPPAFASELDKVQVHWDDALTGRGNLVYQTNERSFSPGDVFETWLYANAFHQDAKKQSDLDALRTFEPTASLTLQMVVCQLAIATVNLDALVRYGTGRAARALDETPTQDVSFGFI